MTPWQRRNPLGGSVAPGSFWAPRVVAMRDAMGLPQRVFRPQQLASAAAELLGELGKSAQSFASADVPLGNEAPRPSPELKVAPRV